MRVLQISSAKNFGGGERHLVDLSKNLDSKQGYEVFVALRYENHWREKLSFLPAENLFHLPLKNSLDVFSARKLARFIKEKNIEIVHAHLARDYPIAALAARMAKAKLILTRHLLFSLNSLHKFVLPKNSIFIAVSEGVRRELLRQNILPPEQIRLIYNGVNTRHFAEAKNEAKKENLRRWLNLRIDCRLVGIVGEITAHKGQTDFVRAAEKVLKQFPDAEFLIVGQDGSPHRKHQKKLEKLTEGLSLRNKIHFLGSVEDVAPVFGALDVFVSASRVEPFGLVIAEAMAAGCAVVAAKTDGATEIVEDNKTGKLVSIENPTELAGAIGELLSNKNLRRTLGENAQKAAIKKFGIEQMVAETEKLYCEILAEND